MVVTVAIIFRWQGLNLQPPGEGFDAVGLQLGMF